MKRSIFRWIFFCVLIPFFLGTYLAFANNDYFESSTYHVTPGSRARVSHLNDAYDAIETGFDKLPGEDELRSNTPYYAVDTGSANTYQITLSYYTAVSYTDGMGVTFKASNSNTGASTLNINSLGAKLITRQDGAGLVAGDIPADKIVSVRYNSTSDNFEIHGAAAGGTGTMASQNANAVTITGGTISGVTLSGNTLSGTTTNSGTISGGTVSGSTLSGTTTNSGTISGGTIDGGTLSGTTTNSGTISGGTVSGGTVSGGTVSGSTLSGTTTNSGTISGGTVNPTTLQIGGVSQALSGTFVNNANGDANIDSDGYDLSTNVSQSTWESIGPTGSGADNIWTDLDASPCSSADFLELRFISWDTIETSGTPGQILTLNAHVRNIGSSVTNNIQNAVLWISDAVGSGGDAVGEGLAVKKVPVTNGVFEFNWVSGFSFNEVAVYLDGCGFNP